MTGGVAASCPSCGASIVFRAGHSRVVVCGHCRSAATRVGTDVALIGKIPDLVATPTKLALGDTFQWRSQTYTILGRLQLAYDAGAWNEWHAIDARGTWVWLAEAEGTLYVTEARDVGALKDLRRKGVYAGLELDMLGTRVVIEEVSQSSIVSAEGELPRDIVVGAPAFVLDGTTRDDRFVTLDFGARASGPEIFAGREVTYQELGLGQKDPRAETAIARRLACARCNASLDVKLATTRTVVCGHCNSVLGLEHDDLKVIGQKGAPPPPPVPLGARGVLLGEALEVVGCVRKQVVVDGESFSWDELLLYGRVGYRWLAVSDGHFTLFQPIAAGKVEVENDRVVYGGRRFKHFQGGKAHIAAVQGELYWEARVGDATETDDYVAPPLVLTREKSRSEIAWTRGEYVAASTVARAFRIEHLPPDRGVGAAMPNPYHTRSPVVLATSASTLLALLVGSAVFAVTASNEPLLTLRPELKQPAGIDARPGLHTLPVTLSDPFELHDGLQALAASVTVDVTPYGFVGVDLALIDDASGESREAALDLNREDESTTSLTETVVFGAVPNGRYVLRVEPVVPFEYSLPRAIEVRLVRDVFLWEPLLFALAALILYPALLMFLAAAFERRRWENSDHPY